jgi:hypothetical protein
MSAQGALSDQLLLMEEQTFDAEEEGQQLALRHGTLINYRAEEASAVLDKTKIKPKRDAASAGDGIPTLLIKVPKGMHFPETRWREGETLKVLAERVTFHKLDVVRFFTDEAILKKYAGVCDALCVCVKLCENVRVCLGNFGLITADVPYGDQKDHAIDPPWSEDTVTSIVAGMWTQVHRDHPSWRCGAVCAVEESLEVRWFHLGTRAQNRVPVKIRQQHQVPVSPWAVPQSGEH